jgi:fructose-1,6-bisphosphatase/inositol monophosphatase family enzyme
MVDSAMKAWDAAPMVAILQEAGGRFTTWAGEVSIWGNDGVATNGALHEQVLEMLKSEKKHS